MEIAMEKGISRDVIWIAMESHIFYFAVRGYSRSIELASLVGPFRIVLGYLTRSSKVEVIQFKSESDHLKIVSEPIQCQAE